MSFSCLHDLHCHTFLSNCCSDPAMLPPAIIDHAVKAGYDTVCLTDHMWDSAVPGCSEWYSNQNIAHVEESLPLPAAPAGLRVLFGCETEYCGGNKLGLARENFDHFDFVVIPVNHMHMKGFVRPVSADNEEKMAALYMNRLEELIQLDLPWAKIGIAHMTMELMFREGTVSRIYDGMEESRLLRVFDFFARKGTGIELNASCFSDEDYLRHPESWLRVYRLAKKAGCRFYCASDAHTVSKLDIIGELLPAVAEALELTKQDRYIVPQG